MLTVALSTWNRAALLRKTLEGMTKMVVPPNVSWELLVVNNNCTDATDTVLQEFSARLPLRRIAESRPGLSHGRNAAVAVARGEYIIITDDDILVDPEWLSAYSDAFARYPDAAVFGGPITPWFDVTLPAWLTQVLPQVGSVFGRHDTETNDVPLSPRLMPYGANMAYRKDILGPRPFNPALGRVGKAMLAGEETALITSLLADGHIGRWVPRARIEHYVRPEQLTLAFLRSYYSGYGRTLAYMEGADGTLLFGKPRWLWREAVQSEVVYRVRRLYTPAVVWIKDFQRASIAWGRLRGPSA